MRVSLLPLGFSLVQPSEAEMAVGDEGAHAEFGGNGLGLDVVVLGYRDLRRIVMGVDLAEKSQGPGRTSPFVMIPRQFGGLGGRLHRRVDLASKQIGLAQVCDSQRMQGTDPDGGGLLCGPLQELEPIDYPSG